MPEKHIAMFIHHETGGSVVAFNGFMKVFKQNGYIIDLYRFNNAGEGFCKLSKFADNNINYDLKLKSRVKKRLPLLREYINVFRYYSNLRKLDFSSKKMAQEIDSKNYDLVFVHCDKILKNPTLLKHLKTRNYYFLPEPERKFYDPPSLFKDELDTRDSQKHLFDKLQSIWYKPAMNLHNYLWKKASDNNIKLSNTNIIANSYFSSESIFRAYNKPSSVCYLGIDHVIKPEGTDIRKNIVLTVGSLHPNKGHSFLVRSLAKVPPSVRPKLIVVTDAKEPLRKQNLIQLSSTLGVDVDVREKIPFEEMYELYCTSKLFLFASRLEPFGIVPLEAMSFGTPVVAIKSGGVRETVKDGVTGLLAEWDTRDFSNKVALLLTNEILWQKLSYNGSEYVKNEWTWDKTFKRFEEIINS